MRSLTLFFPFPQDNTGPREPASDMVQAALVRSGDQEGSRWVRAEAVYPAGEMADGGEEHGCVRGAVRAGRPGCGQQRGIFGSHGQAHDFP